MDNVTTPIYKYSTTYEYPRNGMFGILSSSRVRRGSWCDPLLFPSVASLKWNALTSQLGLVVAFWLIAIADAESFFCTRLNVLPLPQRKVLDSVGKVRDASEGARGSKGV